jgi:hypothetical protein
LISVLKLTPSAGEDCKDACNVRKAVEPVAALHEKPALDEGTQPLNSDMYDDDYELTTSVAFLTSRRKRRVAAQSRADPRTNGSDGRFFRRETRGR